MGTFGDFQARLMKAGMLPAVASYYSEYGNVIKHNFAGQDDIWCYDPVEFLKVMSKQGKYPFTVAVELNFLESYNKRNSRPEVLTGRGEGWKKDRTLLQKDIFNPPDAASYAPSLDPAVRAISKAAPKFDRISDMTALAAMDMFCSIMLGFCPNCTAAEVGEAKANAEDRAFVTAAIQTMELIGQFNRDPVARQNIEADPRYPAFCEALDAVFAGAARYVAKVKNGHAQINGVQSYFERLLSRGEMDEDRCIEAVKLMLFAGVDTTHHVLMWNILHVAENPVAQEKLYEEFKRVLGDEPMQVEHLSKLPYLTQFLRETHRLTPPGPGTVLRRLDEDVDLCGYLVPANTRLTLMSHAVQNDPRYVDNPTEFRPERWSDEEVAKRKGTPKQIIDHQMLAKPFGYGARMCLGARAAELEIKTLMARLLRDWKISRKDPSEKYQIVQGVMLKAEPYPRLKFEPRS